MLFLNLKTTTCRAIYYIFSIIRQSKCRGLIKSRLHYFLGPIHVRLSVKARLSSKSESSDELSSAELTQVYFKSCSSWKIHNGIYIPFELPDKLSTLKDMYLQLHWGRKEKMRRKYTRILTRMVLGQQKYRLFSLQLSCSFLTFFKSL